MHTITNPGGDVVVNTVATGTRPSATLTPAVAGDEQAAGRVARSTVEVGDDGALTVRVPELPSSVINTGGATVITTGGEIAALAIVSVPYEVGVEDIDIQIIADRIEGQNVRGIVAALVAREN